MLRCSRRATGRSTCKASSLLGYAGNNLNQYTRRANETGSIYDADLEEIRGYKKEINGQMNELLTQLSKLQ